MIGNLRVQEQRGGIPLSLPCQTDTMMTARSVSEGQSTENVGDGVKIGRRIRAAIAVVPLLMCLPGLANAQLLGFLGYLKIKTDSDITAGLDEPTRRLIAGLPENIKAQMLDGLRQALPLIDTSVNAYLDKANSIVDTQINHLVCSGQAFVKGTAEEVSGAILGRSPTPLLHLQEQFDGREKTFDAKRELHIVIGYEDYLGRAAITACQSSDSTNLQRVDTLRTAARARWRLWYGLQGNCELPEECYKFKLAAVKSLIAKSEERDVMSTGTRAAFLNVDQNVTKPKFTFSPRWIVFEDEMMKLYAIESSINATRGIRLMLANNAYTDAASILQKDEASQKAARLKLTASDRSLNQQAISDATGISNDKPAIERLLKIADSNDIEMHQRVLDSNKLIGNLEAGLVDITTAANKNISELDKQEKDAAAVAYAKGRQAEDLRKQRLGTTKN